MKKFLTRGMCVAIVAAMLLSFTACGNKDEKEKGSAETSRLNGVTADLSESDESGSETSDESSEETIILPNGEVVTVSGTEGKSEKTSEKESSDSGKSSDSSSKKPGSSSGSISSKPGSGNGSSGSTSKPSGGSSSGGSTSKPGGGSSSGGSTSKPSGGSSSGGSTSKPGGGSSSGGSTSKPGGGSSGGSTSKPGGGSSSGGSTSKPGGGSSSGGSTSKPDSGSGSGGNTSKPDGGDTSKPVEPEKPPVVTWSLQDFINYAISYGKSIGLDYDPTGNPNTGGFDTPIILEAPLSEQWKIDYKIRDIKGRLDRYKREGDEYFWVYAEKRSDGDYNFYIGY